MQTTMTLDNLKSEYNILLAKDQNRAISWLENLLSSEDYYSNWPIAIYSHCQLAKCYYAKNDFDQALVDIQQVIELAAKNDQVNYLRDAYMTMGDIYRRMGIYDRAITSYNSLLQLPKDDDASWYIAKANYRLGTTYFRVNSQEQAIRYYQTALARLNDSGHDQEKCTTLYVMICLGLSESYLTTGQIDQLNSYYQRALNCHAQKPIIDIEHKLKRIRIGLAYHEGDYDKMNAIYSETDALYKDENNHLARLRLLKCYATKSLRVNYQLEVLLSQIDAVTSDAEVNYATGLVLDIYDLAVQVAKKLEDCYREVSYLKRYIKISNAYLEAVRKRQLSAIDVQIETSDYQSEFNKIEQNINHLQAETERLQNESKVLDNTNRRLVQIADIGKKMVSKLNVDDVIASVKRAIDIEMPVDVFYIAVEDPEKEAMCHLSANNSRQDYKVIVALSDRLHPLVRSYLNCETFIISNPDQSPLYQGERYASNVYMSLVVDNQCIGVMALHAKQLNQYNDDQIDLLRALSPYVAIAINNAQISLKLTHEHQMSERDHQLLEAANRHLKAIAEEDPLTKIYNRRYFDENAGKIYHKAIVKKQSFAVIIIDIDDFKVFNDTFGHIKGDEAITAIAQKLNRAFLGYDMLFARYGGEEFIGIVTDIQYSTLVRLCQQLRVAVSALDFTNPKSPLSFLTTSIGATLVQADPAVDFMQLIDRADQCMYQAKQSGKNYVVVKKV